MEGPVTFGLGLIAGGCFFLWLGWRLWTCRGGGSISVLEAIILRAMGKKPLSRSRLDLRPHDFQMVMTGLFGTLLIAVGAYGTCEEAGVV